MSTGSDQSANPLLITHERVRILVRYLKKKRLTILIAGSLGLAFGIFYSQVKKPVYTANLTFSLVEESGLPGGGLLNLASQFGLDLNSSTSDLFSGDNIIELFTSRRIIDSTLLQPFPDTRTTLADRYLDITGLRKNAGLPDPFFPLHQQAPFTRFQDSVLGVLYDGITRAWLTVDKPSNRFDVYQVSFKSRDEVFTKIFTEKLVQEVSDFYTLTKTKKAQYNVDILQKKVDSVYQVYQNALYGKAGLSDANMNPALQLPQVGIIEKQTAITVMGTTYGELIKNLELAKYALLKETPLIQIIDTPQYPLDKKKYSVWFYGPLGMLGFIFLTLAVLIGRKFLKKLTAYYFS